MIYTLGTAYAWCPLFSNEFATWESRYKNITIIKYKETEEALMQCLA
jgi:hypothetical protein